MKLLKGSEDYRTRPRQPEVHPLNHLYPLELNITHQPKVVTPQSQEYEELVNMDVDSEFDFSENDGCDNFVSHTEIPSDLPVQNINPEPVPSLNDEIPLSSDPAPTVRYSGRGRRIKPRTGFEDYVMD